MATGLAPRQPKYHFDNLLFGSDPIAEDSFGLSSRNSSFIEPIRSTESEGRGVSSSRSIRGPSSFATPATRARHGHNDQQSSVRSSVTGSRSAGRGTLSSAGARSGSGRTPGRGPASGTPGPSTRSTIVAIVEGRGLARGEVGMTSIDLRQSELVLSQFSDNPTYPKAVSRLQALNPAEILLPSTATDRGNMSALFKLLTDHFPQVSVTTVQRKHFNETKGLQHIKQLCASDFHTALLEITGKYYCLATAAALLKYVEFAQNMVYAPNSLRVVFKGSEKSTMIDSMTAGHLELINNLSSAKSDHSLYGILNYTKTPGGGRLLRSNILQPPSNLDTITLRLDCVEELTDKEDEFLNIQGLLARFLDVDHLISMFVQIPKNESVKMAEMRITAVIYLKHTLELVEPLRAALEQCANPLFRAYHKTLEDERFTILLDRIQEVIHDSTHYQKGSLNMRTQKCFAIKPRINGLLDVARRTYTEIVDDIGGLITQLAEKYSLPLRTGYNATRSFFIQMPVLPGLFSGSGGSSSSGTTTGGSTTASRSTPSSRSDLSSGGLPAEFIKVVKCKSTISCTTEDLIKLNDRVKESLHEIYLMTNVALNELLAFVREHIGCLYKLSECVSMADMLVSFSHACTLSNYVRPEFTNTLALKQARHPILDKISPEPPVPNNTYAAEGCHFHIITGPNMSGKSTYLKQIMLCQVMAQIGCFVPAQYASFRLCKQLFSRMGCRDDMETNASTFMLEMREAHYILQEASEGCLVIVDELGRGTSSEEGIGICHAICEQLIAKKTYTFFATHFLELTQLEGLYPAAVNYHMDVQHVSSTSGDKLHYTHQLRQGKMQEEQYGIKIAEMSTLPAELIANARSLYDQMQEHQVRAHKSRERTAERAVHTLATCLLQAARNSRLSPESLHTYLQQLRARYLKEVQLQDAE